MHGSLFRGLGGNHVESREPVRRLFRAVSCELRPSTGTQPEKSEERKCEMSLLRPCHPVCRVFHQFREMVQESATQQLSSIFVPDSAMCNPSSNYLPHRYIVTCRKSPAPGIIEHGPLITLKAGMRIGAKQGAVTEGAHHLRSGALQQRRSESSNLDGHAQKPQSATAADPLILNRNRRLGSS
jgi:hypothetical protein